LVYIKTIKAKKIYKLKKKMHLGV